MMKTIASSFLALGLVLAVTADTAEARSRSGYCRDRAMQASQDRGDAGTVLMGGVGGALAGAAIGGLVDRRHGRGAGRGALIGGVGGLATGAIVDSENKRSVYNQVYSDCMGAYDAPEPRATRRTTRSGAQACAARYRSYNPNTGLYMSSSGRWRPCN